ncbi:MAG: cytochrome B [Methylophaga sp.]|nr:MAG: cytochrome B [Methylophaga sp.]
MANSPQKFKSYPVWDKTVRIFHWINVLSMLGLMVIGTVILNAKALGVPSDGKILLKSAHVYMGYIFFINLSWRIIWGFIGSYFARWRMILPIGKLYRTQLVDYIAALKSGRPTASYLGHNPIARLMVAMLFFLMSIQAVTGLVLAGTDVYMPPFGGIIKEWVALDANMTDEIKPYSKEGVNSDSYTEMRDFREPFISTHYYVFFLLIGAILLHLVGVLVAELKEQNGLISAMFTGNKVFKNKPVDME